MLLAASKRGGWLQRVKPTGGLAGISSILLFLFVWEMAARLRLLDPNFVPPPTVVVAEAISMVQTRMLVQDLAASLKRSLGGFALGSLIGIAMGLLTGRVQLLRQLFEPIIQLFRPIPSIAFVPLAILWFGLGESPKLFLITYGVFFPVWLNTHVGVGAVDINYIRAAKCLGAKDRQLFLEVVLPAALPFVVAGLRLGIAVSFIVLVAAEMTGASAGLGFRIEESHLIFRADRMLVGLLMLGILGATADAIFNFVSSKLLFWSK